MGLSKNRRGEIKTFSKLICIPITANFRNPVNITDKVKEVIEQSGFKRGMVFIDTKNTTTGLLIQEDEPLLMRDFMGFLNRLFPKKNYYRHDDFRIRTVNREPNERKNGWAHLKASLLPSHVAKPFNRSALSRGTWQNILFFDFDHRGRKKRKIEVICIGE